MSSQRPPALDLARSARYFEFGVLATIGAALAFQLLIMPIVGLADNADFARLMGPLGPWVNLSSGLASYSWPRFLAWDVAGELVWVGLYVTAGMVFTDQVSAIAELSSNLAWGLAALVAAVLGALWLLRSRRNNDSTEADAE